MLWGRSNKKHQSWKGNRWTIWEKRKLKSSKKSWARWRSSLQNNQRKRRNKMNKKQNSKNKSRKWSKSKKLTRKQLKLWRNKNRKNKLGQLRKYCQIHLIWQCKSQFQELELWLLNQVLIEHIMVQSMKRCQRRNQRTVCTWTWWKTTKILMAEGLVKAQRNLG